MAQNIKTQYLNELKKIISEMGKEQILHAKKVRLFSRVIVDKIIEAQLFPNVADIKTTLNYIPNAAYFHDIGKSMIDKEYWYKSDVRTDIANTIYESHVNKGFEAFDQKVDFLELSGTAVDEMSQIISAILEHHERYDGRGFPNGLTGKEISLAGRIVAVADALDNYLTSTKDKDLISLDLAIDKIQMHKNSRFDPTIVDALVLGKEDIEDKLYLLENNSLTEIQTIEDKNRPMELMYRAIFNTLTRQTYSYEATLKLYDKSYGTIFKAVYEPIAEKYDLVKDLTDYEFKELSKNYLNLIRRGVSFEKIYISVSTKYLSKKYAADTIINILEQNSVNPTKIVIELSESLIAGLRIRVLENVEILRRRGIGVALSDFGSDYSSLSKLADLNITEIFLSSEFASQAVQNQVIREVIRSIVSMAKNLKLTIVACGIETKAQEQAMKELGVRLMTGSFYGNFKKEQYIRADSRLKAGSGNGR
ncbi:MAG: EAL domain-containing protein [Gammaproteobacteria bacterium]|nr:EAL domain-containing protein [Gammaproteobacteria bacterium]